MLQPTGRPASVPDDVQSVQERPAPEFVAADVPFSDESSSGRVAERDQSASVGPRQLPSESR